MESSSNKSCVKMVCRYNYHGFCRRGESCNFFHSLVDCKQHMQEGYCSERACTDRHRYTCRFYKTRVGCKREACAYLHREDKAVQDESDHVKELEVIINNLKLDLKGKDSEIMTTTKLINELKEDLDSKMRDIIEKDKIINIIKNTHKTYDTEDEDSDDSIEIYASKADKSDTNSTFDFTQLDLSDTNVLEEGKEKLSKTKKKDLQCKQCEYKCKLKSTLKKHMNTKHGATR